MAISDFEKKKVVLDYLKDKDFSFEILIDEKGKTSESYKAFVLPSTFLIDRQGNAVGRVAGIRAWDSPEIRKVIESLLDMPTSDADRASTKGASSPDAPKTPR